MQITAIKPRRKHLSALYIDGEFAMTLDTRVLLENRVDVGNSLSDEQLKDLIEQSNERRAKEKALWLLSYRSHSKKELTDKIKRTGDEAAAVKAVERMEELGLVNDEDFARQYAQKLLFSKRMSKRSAVYELQRKGIDRTVAENTLEEFDVDEQEQIREILERKYKDLSDGKIRRRAVAALQRLGYRWDDISPVLAQLCDSE